MTPATFHRRFDVRGLTEVRPDELRPLQRPQLPRRCAEPPELRLMRPVLQDALRTFCQHADVEGGRAARLFQETADWFGSPDATSPFSFEAVCDALELDAAWIRGLLAGRRRRDASRAPRVRPVE